MNGSVNKLIMFKKNLMLFLMAILLIIIISRLFYLQIVQYEIHSSKANAQSSRTETITRDRGQIFDRFGLLIVGNKELASLYTYGSEVSKPQELADDLSSSFGIQISNATVDRLNNLKSFIWLKRLIPVKQAIDISQKYSYINFLHEEARYYPQGELYNSFVGATGIDNQGLSDMEYYFNKHLIGANITVNTIKDSKGRTLAPLDLINYRKDTPYIQLTTSTELQAGAEFYLKAGVEQFDATIGFAVAMDIKTGHILFYNNYTNPKYKSNIYATKNPSTFLFEPGSIFKIVSFGYLVGNNLYNETSLVDISKELLVQGHYISDDTPHGDLLSQRDIFSFSSNIGTSLLMANISNRNFYNYMKSLGFGEKTGIEGVSEETGFIRNSNQWSKLDHYSTSFGQSFLVTPLQMLNVFAAIANNGVLNQPQLVSNYYARGRESSISSSRVELFSKKEVEVLKKLCREVVVNGTGQILQNDVVSIAGKTGTAQVFNQTIQQYSKKEYVASFAGFFPYENPRVAMIVIYYSPRTSIYASTTASMTFKNIAMLTAATMGLSKNLPLNEPTAKIGE